MKTVKYCPCVDRLSSFIWRLEIGAVGVRATDPWFDDGMGTNLRAAINLAGATAPAEFKSIILQRLVKACISGRWSVSESTINPTKSDWT
jgi:hypothetical protein